MKKQTIKLSESQLHRVIKESVRKVLREGVKGSIQHEVETIVRKMGSTITEWYPDYELFIDNHGCNGYIMDSEQAAEEYILDDYLQNAIDYVEGAMRDEEWIDYLQKGGVDANTAQQLVRNNDWEGIVRIIVKLEGPHFFLSEYSGRVYELSNGQVLYY